MYKRIKKHKYIIIYSLIAFLPRLILTQFMMPVGTALDEVSVLALPAYLAGYDWSYLMGKMGLYYGYGMSVLFTPFFVLIKDPVILYRTILIMCGLLQMIPGYIAFYLLGKFFEQNNNIIKLLLSLIASYCVLLPVTSVGNEHMLYVVVWVMGWILIELINCKDNKRKNIYSCILAFVSFYALTCHERSKVFVIAITCIIVLYWFMEKQYLVAPIPFLLVSSLSYKIVRMLTDKVQKTIWLLGDKRTYLANTSTSVPVGLLAHKNLWKVWHNIILGQLGTGAVYTGGLLAVAIVFGMWMLVKKVILIRKMENSFNNNYFYIIIFGLMTIGGFIFAQSLTWLWNAQMAVVDSTKSEGGRAFTYLRYYFPCVGIVIVLTLNWLISHYEEKLARCILYVAFGLVVLLQINFIFSVIPLIEKTPILNYVHNVYWVFSFMKDGEFTNKCTWVPACIICIVVFGFFILFYRRKKNSAGLLLLLVLLMYQYSARGINDGILRSYKNYQAIEKTWEILEKLSDNDILPEYIGIGDAKIKSTAQRNSCIYQFLLQNQRINCYESVSNVKEAIFVQSWPKTWETIIKDDDIWYRMDLTEEQYIFFKGDKLEKYFRSEGYEYYMVGE